MIGNYEYLENVRSIYSIMVGLPMETSYSEQDRNYELGAKS